MIGTNAVSALRGRFMGRGSLFPPASQNGVERTKTSVKKISNDLLVRACEFIFRMTLLDEHCAVSLQPSGIKAGLPGSQRRACDTANRAHWPTAGLSCGGSM